MALPLRSAWARWFTSRPAAPTASAVPRTAMCSAVYPDLQRMRMIYVLGKMDHTIYRWKGV